MHVWVHVTVHGMPWIVGVLLLSAFLGLLGALVGGVAWLVYRAARWMAGPRGGRSGPLVTRAGSSARAGTARPA